MTSGLEQGLVWGLLQCKKGTRSLCRNRETRGLENQHDRKRLKILHAVKALATKQVKANHR